MSRKQKGLLFALISYLLWAFLAIYWKQLSGVSSYDTFSYRILWTFVTMLIYGLVTRRLSTYINQTKGLIKEPKAVVRLVGAGFFIAINWLVYIYAVSSGQATQASIGYYMQPLAVVLLALLFLKEKLDGPSWIALGLAFIGVGIMVLETGELPMVTVVLALSFAIYSLLKKGVHLSSDLAMLLEAGVVLPFVLVYLIGFSDASWSDYRLNEQVLLIFSGVIPAIPLLFFAEAVKRAPLNQVGFIQYINPTLQLLIAQLIFQEPMHHGIIHGLVIIWVGIAIFIGGQVYRMKRKPD